MAKHHYKRISLSNLLLDLENPRHDVLSNQTEVLRTLLDHQGDKLVKLARDIVNEGTNPADLPIVVPHPEASDQYVVVEGNRRIAAIKMLCDPGLALAVNKPSIRRHFEELSKEYSGKSVEELDCVVFDHREDAYHWIELRHTGENEGVGIVGWDAAAVARFKKGQSWMALQVVEFVKENAELDETDTHRIQHLPLTNLARLVNDPDVREALGLRAESGALKATLPQPDILKGLTKVVTDVATGAITVNEIRTKSQRQEYVESLVRSQHIATSAAEPVPSWGLPVPVAAASGRRGRRPSTARKALIPTKCVLRISHPRLNKIYRELKLLDVDQFTNCAAVMLRVFLELSLDEYMHAKHISLRGDSTLAKKLLAVADYLAKEGLLENNKLKPVRVAVSSRDSLLSTDTLHAYVHNKDLTPKAGDLKTTWDDMQPFMETIWL